MILDAIDLAILSMLQTNARVSNAEIARQIGMTPSAILERIRKLEERGVIQGYSASVNPDALGLGLTAFIFVVTDEGPGQLSCDLQLASIPEVQEVHHIAGEDCYLVKVRVADTAAMSRLLRDQIGTLDHVRSTRTTIVLDTVKESHLLPLELLNTNIS